MPTPTDDELEPAGPRVDGDGVAVDGAVGGVAVDHSPHAGRVDGVVLESGPPALPEAEGDVGQRGLLEGVAEIDEAGDAWWVAVDDHVHRREVAMDDEPWLAVVADGVEGV